MSPTTASPSSSAPTRYLYFDRGPRAGETVPLSGHDYVVLGRSLTAGVQIPDDGISGKHAALRRREDEYVLVDLESTNGCFVNESRIDRRDLVPGDRIRLGETVIVYAADRRADAGPRVRHAAPRGGEPPLVSIRIEEQPDEYARRLDREDREASDPGRSALAVRHLSCLYVASHALAGGGATGAPLQDLLDSLAGFLRPDRACIVLYDLSNDAYAFPVVHGPIRRDEDHGEISRSILHDVIEGGLSVLTNDALVDDRFDTRDSIVASGVRAIMAAPVEHQGSVLGALYLDTVDAPGRFTEADVELLGAIGRLVGLVLFNQRAEDQMATMQKFHSLGVLISGIVHQLRSPLTVIQGRAELLLMKDAPEPEERRRHLQSILDAAERVGGTISNLLHFAREPDGTHVRFSLREAVQAALELVDSEVRSAGIELAVDVPPDVRVEGNRNAIEQVFLNLAHNAVQALRRYRTDPRIAIRALPGEGRVHVLFSDNGPGVPPGLGERIFDPFFTSNKGEEGTGLGLSLAMDIVHKHGGSMRLDPHAVEGACFELVLPLRQGDDAPSDVFLAPPAPRRPDKAGAS